MYLAVRSCKAFADFELADSIRLLAASLPFPVAGSPRKGQPLQRFPALDERQGAKIGSIQPKICHGAL